MFGHKHLKKIRISTLEKESEKPFVPLLLQMGWTKEETDYLLDMLEQFDLRFVVVADRYNVSEWCRAAAGRHSAGRQAGRSQPCQALHRAWFHSTISLPLLACSGLHATPICRVAPLYSATPVSFCGRLPRPVVPPAPPPVRLTLNSVCVDTLRELT